MLEDEVNIGNFKDENMKVNNVDRLMFANHFGINVILDHFWYFEHEDLLLCPI